MAARFHGTEISELVAWVRQPRPYLADPAERAEFLEWIQWFTTLAKIHDEAGMPIDLIAQRLTEEGYVIDENMLRKMFARVLFLERMTNLMAKPLTQNVPHGGTTKEQP